MKIWINKSKIDLDENDNEEYLIFNLLEGEKASKSNIKTDIELLWKKFGTNNISEINEDFIIIALSVFAVDKRIPRKISSNSWNRDLELFIPVFELEKWKENSSLLEKTISFLSGDNWHFNFRKTNHRFRKTSKRKYNILDKSKYDSVSLFSGGLDSYTGAIELLEKNNNTCFVGFKEYGLLAKRQYKLFNILDNLYNNSNINILLFSGTPYAPIISQSGERYMGSLESTSRSRSLLFLAGALVVASIIGEEIPVFIPENGFIGLNVPLTPSRKSTCSTRTTHSYFINNLNKILLNVGIKNKIENFYAHKTKGQMIDSVKNSDAFKEGAGLTISCSHPCLSRYDGITPPVNCGYCYPCIIRRAAMNKIGFYDEKYNENYSISKEFIYKFNSLDSRASDLKAVLWSLRRYLNSDETEIKNLIRQTGLLTTEEIEKYYQLYCKSMEEIKNLILFHCEQNNDQKLLDYVGLNK